MSLAMCRVLHYARMRSHQPCGAQGRHEVPLVPYKVHEAMTGHSWP